MDIDQLINLRKQMGESGFNIVQLKGVMLPVDVSQLKLNFEGFDKACCSAYIYRDGEFWPIEQSE